MRIVTFPSETQAQAFLDTLRTQSLTTQGDVVTAVGDDDAATLPDGRTVLQADDERTYVDAGGGTADDAGVGAIKGSGAGAAVGFIGGAVATVLTGGLALPILLGMTALGSGVGASVGAIGGAAGVDETHGTSLLGTEEVHLTDAERAHLEGLTADGRTVVLHDSADLSVLTPLIEAHGGTINT